MMSGLLINQTLNSTLLPVSLFEALQWPSPKAIWRFPLCPSSSKLFLILKFHFKDFHSEVHFHLNLILAEQVIPHTTVADSVRVSLGRDCQPLRVVTGERREGGKECSLKQLLSQGQSRSPTWKPPSKTNQDFFEVSSKLTGWPTRPELTYIYL